MTEESKALTLAVSDIRQMAEAVAKSGLFGMKTTDQAMALMLIAHAEGLHPAIAARDYHIIQGRPSKSAEAMQRSFLALGGKIEWNDLTDEKCSATFSHPQGGTVTVEWDLARAKRAGLEGKDNWKKHPRQMLRARVVSEGVRTVHPGATSGMYTPEEVKDFDEPKKVRVKVEKTEEPKPPEPDPEWSGKTMKELPLEALNWLLSYGTKERQETAAYELGRRAKAEGQRGSPSPEEVAFVGTEPEDIVGAEGLFS